CEFLREHPEITLNALTANRFVDLQEEHIDVAVRIGKLVDSPLIAIKVGLIRAVTCASPEYLERKGTPSTLEDLAGHDVIQFLNMVWTQLDGLLIPETWSVRVHASDASVACTAALQGLGIARVPDFMVNEELQSGALIEVLPDHAPDPFPVHLVY